MAVTPVTSSTGDTVLPDIGTLSYNGITFSSLYTSKVAGRAVPDNAARTIKYVEWTITVTGTVTLSAGQQTTDANWVALRQKLDTYGGNLVYRGKGFGDLVVNTPGGNLVDVAWGPKTQTIDFQPLGASRSAYITWTVSTCVPELAFKPGITASLGRVVVTPRVLQFNWQIAITYDEDGLSGFTIAGTLEIPMTRITVDNRTLPDNVDNYRQAFLDLEIDLTRFRVVRRRFDYSRDKRTMEWEFEAQELPRMGLPESATTARGIFSVRNATQGPGFAQWICTLRATYTIRKDTTPRAAWWAFLSLLHFRMNSSARGSDPTINQQSPGTLSRVFDLIRGLQGGNIIRDFRRIFQAQQTQEPSTPEVNKKPILMSFSFDEGLYLDSKTMSFEASWMVITTFASIFLATGIWRWPGGTLGGTTWATSVRNIMGWKGNLQNRLNPNADVIIDIGGGSLPTSPPENPVVNV